jgi:hypothetical protein
MREPMTNTLMKIPLTNALKRGACLAGLAAFGLVATPGSAQAAFITFTVDESVVPGTPINSFQADLLNGGYDANLVLNPSGGDTNVADGSGSGTWSETATATFSQYFLNGSSLFDQFIGDNEGDGYVILGSLTSSGTYVEDSCGPVNCVIFSFTTQIGSLGIDSDQDGVVDIPLLSASGVGAGTGGSILFTGGPTGGTGSFVSNFETNTLAGGLAPAYWPTLANLSFVTTISGDVNELDLPSVTGDISVQFSTTAPEPASLTLLALGLMGFATAARRRRV